MSDDPDVEEEECHEDDNGRKRPRTDAQLLALANARTRALEVRRENAMLREREKVIDRAEKKMEKMKRLVFLMK